MLIVAMNQVDDSAGNVVEVEYGWESVQAGGVKLVAVFHGKFGERRKVSSLNGPDHVVHPSGNHVVRTVLGQTGRISQDLSFYCHKIRQVFLMFRVSTFSSSLVCTLVCMPEVLPTGFRSSLTCEDTGNKFTSLRARILIIGMPLNRAILKKISIKLKINR